MIKTLKTMLSTVLLSAGGVVAHAAPWTLDGEASRIVYGTIKQNAVGEVNVFEALAGSVTEDGAVSISIDLAAVETYIDIRNERMIKHVFRNVPSAELTAQIDMADLMALPVGATTDVFIEGDLSFIGVDLPIETEAFVARLSETQVLVTSNDMIFLGTEEAGVDEGVTVLQDIAELNGITRTVPVTFRFVFSAEGDVPVAAELAESDVTLASVAGDPDAGRRVFRQCSACHVLDEGVNRVGPSLHGIFGATAGQVEGFRYSDVMAESGIVWDQETLSEFLANPRDVLPGNRMAFRGIRDEEDLQDLMAYLIQELEG
ncbi:cytochrome c family protein [Thalassococcus sp. S3]|uniref:c-type cytochrome n=1 Tax=Thalassococcus sp. S3 TaxID=2017482 RepID=UPI00102452D8|nr:cytochrome c family protein [Thalassococcus sp. S3]QBF33686.1 cytochrome C [Thalassococcus sp. S3]